MVMKKILFCLLMASLLVAIPVLAACTCGTTPATTTTPTTTTPTTTTPTTTTPTTTTPTTTTPTTTTPTMTTTTPTTTTPTTTTPTTTTPTTTTPTTTTPTTTTPTTTTEPGETLGEILGRSAGINSVKYDMVMTYPGEPVMTMKMWIKGNKMRSETTAEGQTIITLLDMDAQTIYIYYPDQNMAMEMTYEPGESAMDEAQAITDYNPTILGHETLDGKVCLVVQYTAEGATVKMWLWEQYGFPIRVETTTSEGTAVVEYKNIEFGDITDTMFELPEGVEIMDMPGM
jgi:hypothetical protein